MRGVVSEALAGGKVVWGDPCTEGSQKAKVCNDEQVGWQSFYRTAIRRI